MKFNLDNFKIYINIFYNCKEKEIGIYMIELIINGLLLDIKCLIIVLLEIKNCEYVLVKLYVFNYLYRYFKWDLNFWYFKIFVK